MEKLKSLLVKIKSTLTLRTYRKPLPITIFRFVLLNAVVVLSAVFITRAVDPTYVDGNIVKLLTHFASCMVTPNTFVRLVDIVGEHPWVVLISLIVIAIELVLFSGAVIATLSTAIRSYINRKGEAKGKVYLHNHFVILNWNGEVPDLLYNLMIKNYRRTVIILSDKTKDEVYAEVESAWAVLRTNNRQRNKLKLIVKRGDPLLESDLEDVSIGEADHILVMSRDGQEESNDPRISGKDLLSLKIVLALGNFRLKSDCNVVIETESDETKKRMLKIIRNLGLNGTDNVTVVSLNNKIGQVLAQALLEPRIAAIYGEVLSFRGHEFYSCEADGVEDYLVAHDSGIPVLKENGNVFVFAKDERQVWGRRIREVDLSVVEKLPMRDTALSVESDFYVIGNSKKLAAIQRNLKLAKKGYDAQFKDDYFDKLDVDKIVSSIRKSDPQRKKRVLLLSDDTKAAGSDADIFVNLINLRTQLAELPMTNVSYAVELSNAKNETAVKRLNVDTVVKSRYIMALLLSRIALNKDARIFYDALLEVDSEEGGDYFDIKVEKVGEMLDFDKLETNEDGKVEFERASDLIHRFYVSFDKKYMLLGYVQEDKTVFLPSRQDRRTNIALSPENEFIFIKY